MGIDTPENKNPTIADLAIRQKLFFHLIRPIAKAYDDKKKAKKSNVTKTTKNHNLETETASQFPEQTEPYFYDFGKDPESSEKTKENFGLHRVDKIDAYALINSDDDKHKSSNWYQPADDYVKAHHQKMGIPFLGGLSGTDKVITANLKDLFGRQLDAQEYWRFQFTLAALMVESQYHSFYEVIFIAAAYEPAYLYLADTPNDQKLGYKILQDLQAQQQRITSGQPIDNSIYKNTLNIINEHGQLHHWESIVPTMASADYPPPYHPPVEHNVPVPVSEWRLPSSSSDSVQNSKKKDTHYQMQLIIQLEDDEVVMNSAVALANKHLKRSILVQVAADGKYRVVERKTDGTWQPLDFAESTAYLKKKFELMRGEDSNPAGSWWDTVIT